MPKGNGKGGLSRVRRPVYMNSGQGWNGQEWVYGGLSTNVNVPKSVPNVPLPSAEDFQSALASRPGALNGTIGGGDLGRDVRWGTAEHEKFRQFVPLPDVADVSSGGGGGPSRQDLIDAAFANLSSPDVYTGEADLQALADYYGGARGRLDDVYGGAVGRIGATTAETLAALAEMDPQAAFVYDVGAPTIPGVNVDYLRALGASADPVSAEAEFARELLGYQLAASQQASAGMQASLDRERQARLAASRLMQQEGLRLAEQARAQALAQIASQQAAEEAMIRERVRAAQQAEAERQQELEMLRLELALEGI